MQKNLPFQLDCSVISKSGTVNTHIPVIANCHFSKCSSKFGWSVPKLLLRGQRIHQVQLSLGGQTPQDILYNHSVLDVCYHFFHPWNDDLKANSLSLLFQCKLNWEMLRTDELQWWKTRIYWQLWIRQESAELFLKMRYIATPKQSGQYVWWEKLWSESYCFSSL